MSATFKAAVDRLADKMLLELDRPKPDFEGFAARAFGELSLSQITEIGRTSDQAFTSALARAAVRKMAERQERRGRRMSAGLH